MDARSVPLTRVSYHAVFRYVQRVLGVELPAIDGEAEKARAERYCAAAGLFVDDVRSMILTPAVAHASMTGCTCVRTDTIRVSLAADTGAICTVMPLRQRKKLKVLTRRELHRDARKHNHRKRRRPASEDGR